MSYTTYSVKRKDLTDYYLPKKDMYDLMIASINANGYGQKIFNFISTFDNSINSFNIWNPTNNRMEVYDPNNDVWYTEALAGPSLWGVTSQEGLDFLNGTFSIGGLAKLKYCNNCSNRNGLSLPTITSFSDRFGSLDEMMSQNLTDTGFLFYDYAKPQRQNYFPSVFSTTVGNYVFRDWQKTPKTELQVAADTGIPREDITMSIDNSEPIIPPKTFNYLLRWCCDPNITTVIELPYELSSKVVSFRDQSGARPPCWTASPTTDGAIEIVESVIEYEFCADCYSIHGLCRR